MATVVLPDNFSALTNGERELSTKAQTYRELVAELILRWPQRQIYQEAFLEEIGADSEVFFMARIEGG